MTLCVSTPYYLSTYFLLPTTFYFLLTIRYLLLTTEFLNPIGDPLPYSSSRGLEKSYPQVGYKTIYKQFCKVLQLIHQEVLATT